MFSWIPAAAGMTTVFKFFILKHGISSPPLEEYRRSRGGGKRGCILESVVSNHPGASRHPSNGGELAGGVKFFILKYCSLTT